MMCRIALGITGGLNLAAAFGIGVYVLDNELGPTTALLFVLTVAAAFISLIALESMEPDRLVDEVTGATDTRTESLLAHTHDRGLR